MVKKVLEFIRENKIFENGDSVILGVSGGADSICMLEILCKLKERLHLTLYVVHVNHGIRGEAARGDAEFVEKVCTQLGVDFFLYEIDVPAIVEKTGMSEEEAGRKERYRIFQSLLKQKGADKIAVAHNLNDNSETILFNLFRGTGIKGMTGIPVKRDVIVRPLLSCTRQEIEQYLTDIHRNYCIDSTNKSTEYTRNKIRLELFPYIKENINEKAEYNIVNAAEKLNEIKDYVEQQTNIEYERYVTENRILLEAGKLHPAIKKEIIRRLIEKQAGSLKDITNIHIKQVEELFMMPVSKKINLPYHLLAVKDYDCIVIKNIESAESSENFTEKVLIGKNQIYEDDCIRITLESDEFCLENIEELVYTKWLDYDKIDKLILRTRAQGDYIVIDDSGRRKKLKEYFINEKIPKEKRDRMFLLADGNHIVWIPGYRISSYYKVTEKTKHIVRVDFKDKE